MLRDLRSPICWIFVTKNYFLAKKKIPGRRHQIMSRFFLFQEFDKIVFNFMVHNPCHQRETSSFSLSSILPSYLSLIGQSQTLYFFSIWEIIIVHILQSFFSSSYIYTQVFPPLPAEVLRCIAFSSYFHNTSIFFCKNIDNISLWLVF